MAEPVSRPIRKGFRLSGEPESSNNLEDARHWRGVYKELVEGFRWMAAAQPGTRRRAGHLQVERLKQRFAFWDTRCRELLEEATVQPIELAAAKPLREGTGEA